MKTRRPYTPPMPYSWWLRSSNYRRYMLREITCIWIGAYVAALIAGLYSLKQGAVEWQAFLAALGSPAGVLFQLIALVFALYHAVSWFSLAPSTMPIWRGENQVPPRWIEIAHYVAWLAVSILIIWLAVA